MITSSLSRAAAAAEPVRAAPTLTAPTRAASATSYATTLCPFFTRFASIGWPMAPVPINPIFMNSPPSVRRGPGRFDAPQANAARAMIAGCTERVKLRGPSAD